MRDIYEGVRDEEGGGVPLVRDSEGTGGAGIGAGTEL